MAKRGLAAVRSRLMQKLWRCLRVVCKACQWVCGVWEGACLLAEAMQMFLVDDPHCAVGSSMRYIHCRARSMLKRLIDGDVCAGEGKTPCTR